MVVFVTVGYVVALIAATRKPIRSNMEIERLQSKGSWLDDQMLLTSVYTKEQEKAVDAKKAGKHTPSMILQTRRLHRCLTFFAR
jgi:hypothetical protein